eukprot:gene14231-16791_t
MKEMFKRLVLNGQIEFVGGGWVMNDEACPDISAVINQMREGHLFLNKTFGVASPESAWQIDPFGHSSVSANLFAQMGFRHVVLNRVPLMLKEKMKTNHELQFIWNGNPALGRKANIFAHVLDDNYSFLPYLNIDNMEAHIPIADALEKFLVDIRDKRARYGNAPHILMKMGDDFAFSQPRKLYDIMDPMIALAKTKFPKISMDIIKVISIPTISLENGGQDTLHLVHF